MLMEFNWINWITISKISFKNNNKIIIKYNNVRLYKLMDEIPITSGGYILWGLFIFYLNGLNNL